MAKTHVPSFWDDPRNQAKLEQLAKKKFSASQIGEKLGVTKNSVIGRSRRTGVKLCSERRALGDYLINWLKIPGNLEYRTQCIKEGIADAKKKSLTPSSGVIT